MTDTDPAARQELTAQRLKSFIERIERLQEERAATNADIREVFSEAYGVGFDVKAIRQLISLRKMEQSDREQQEHMLTLYKETLGMR
jgi:uncharacterized protein (UPF0335 family)